MICGEGVENDDVKTNKKWLWIGKAKQESRKWEIKENEIRRDFEKMMKEFGNRFLKQDKNKEENYKRKFMATNY